MSTRWAVCVNNVPGPVMVARWRWLAHWYALALAHWERGRFYVVPWDVTRGR